MHELVATETPDERGAHHGDERHAAAEHERVLRSDGLTLQPAPEHPATGAALCSRHAARPTSSSFDSGAPCVTRPRNPCSTARPRPSAGATGCHTVHEPELEESRSQVAATCWLRAS